MKQIMLSVSGVGLLISVVFASYKLGFFAPSLAQLKGNPIEETPMVDLGGHRHSFTELQGHATTVYFWATWCRPCLEHLSALAKGHERPPSNYFLPVAIERDPEAVADTLTRLGYHGQVWVATDGMGLLQRRYAGNTKRAVPYSVELSVDGSIQSAQYGE